MKSIQQLSHVVNGQYTLMMMTTGSEVPKAIFSFDDSVMGSQNSESCYSWWWLITVKGYRLTSSKAKAHGAKSRRDQVRLSGCLLPVESQRATYFPQRQCGRRRYMKDCQPGKLGWALVSRSFIRDQSHRHRLCAKLTLVTQCPALPEVKWCY